MTHHFVCFYSTFPKRKGAYCGCLSQINMNQILHILQFSVLPRSIHSIQAGVVLM